MDAIVIITVEKTNPGPFKIPQDLNHSLHLEGITGYCSEERGVLFPVTQTGAGGKVANLIEETNEQQINQAKEKQIFGSIICRLYIFVCITIKIKIKNCISHSHLP